jgi:glycine/D-amino acid oxidase-like deaminating enzyme
VSRGHQRTLTDVALQLEYREASGEILTPELFPRADGTTWVCAISTVGPVPVDPADVAPDPGAHARIEALCRNISPALAAAPIKARQACFRRYPRFKGSPLGDRPRSSICRQ